jgi:hypothetical protein
MIISVIRSSSKLACARGLRAISATSSLGEVLSLSSVDEDDLYEAMDGTTSVTNRGRTPKAIPRRWNPRSLLHVIGGL